MPYMVWLPVLDLWGCMANNRMVIVCKKCKVARAIAKYYPSTGWYSVSATATLNDFFNRHDHRFNGHISDDEWNDGGEPFLLSYETDDPGRIPWEYEQYSEQFRKEILFRKF